MEIQFLPPTDQSSLHELYDDHKFTVLQNAVS
jgi:hypothetical protein